MKYRKQFKSFLSHFWVNPRYQLIALFFIVGLFVVPLLRSGFYESHDGEAHVARFAAYYKAFVDGQLLPRWAGDLNYHYGSPIFIFYYPLPGYIGSLLHGGGISFEHAFTALIIFAFIASAISFYLWAATLWNRNVAFVGALLYALSPYHFLNLYVRGDIAELLALGLVPLVFYFIEHIQRKKDTSAVLSGSIVYALVILAHHGISLIFSPVFVLYILLRVKGNGGRIRCLFLLGLGLMLSAFFWLPGLVEAKYTHRQLFIGEMYQEHFPSVGQLIYSPWGFGPDVNKVGGLSPQIGTVVLALIASIVVVWKKIRERVFFFGWLVVFIGSIFITTALSGLLWHYLPLLKLLEFPWRFTAVSSFAAVVLACFALTALKQTKVYLLVVGLLCITSLPLVKTLPIPARGDSYYTSYLGTTYYHGEASTIWTAGDPGKKPQKSSEIIEGEGSLQNVVRRSQLHTFSVDAKTAVKILDNTIYFPGWKVYVDNKKVTTEFQDMQRRGLITFVVPAGTHMVRVAFEESAIRLLADIVSIVAMIGIVLYWIKLKVQRSK